MTSEYSAPNIDLQVRTIVVNAGWTAEMGGVEAILSSSKVQDLLKDDDSIIYFWREIERQFDIVVTRAQRASLPTVGSVVHYLKLRAKAEVNG